MFLSSEGDYLLVALVFFQGVASTNAHTSYSRGYSWNLFAESIFIFKSGWLITLSNFIGVRLLRYGLPISLLILRKKPTVLQSIKGICLTLCLSLLWWRHCLPLFPRTLYPTGNTRDVKSTTNYYILPDIYLLKMPFGKRKKWHFWALEFETFSVGACSQTSLLNLQYLQRSNL